jgi:hypothetical protein
MFEELFTKNFGARGVSRRPAGSYPALPGAIPGPRNGF